MTLVTVKAQLAKFLKSLEGAPRWKDERELWLKVRETLILWNFASQDS